MSNKIIFSVIAVLIFVAVAYFFVTKNGTMRMEENQELVSAGEMKESVNSAPETATPLVERRNTLEQSANVKPVAGDANSVWYPIPELGIEIKVNKTFFEDLIYQVATWPSDGEAPVRSATFTTKRLLDIAKKEGAPEYAEDDSYICFVGSFSRYELSQADLDKEGYEYTKSHGAFVDGMFIVHSTPQAVCTLKDNPEDRKYEQALLGSWWGGSGKHFPENIIGSVRKLE